MYKTEVYIDCTEVCIRKRRRVLYWRSCIEEECTGGLCNGGCILLLMCVVNKVVGSCSSKY